MNRSTFIAVGASAAIIAAAAAEAIAGAATTAATEGAPTVRVFGEAARFPGDVLKCFEDPEGEIYLAYSAEALVEVDNDDALGGYTVDDFHVLDNDIVISNAPPGVECDGRCSEREPGTPADGHECFVPRAVIDEWVRAIDGGEVERNHDRVIASAIAMRQKSLADPERAAHLDQRIHEDVSFGLRPWHPSTAGCVSNLWTMYG